jgi:hypothetical protein
MPDYTGIAAAGDDFRIENEDGKREIADALHRQIQREADIPENDSDQYFPACRP